MDINAELEKALEENFDEKVEEKLNVKKGIYVDEKDIAALKEKYKGAVGIINKHVKYWCEYYTKKPFKEREKRIYLQDLKDQIILINGDYKEEEVASVSSEKERREIDEDVEDNEIMGADEILKAAQKITGKEKIELLDVHKVYKKWLKVSDDKRIDLGLAVALTREIKGTKLWLWIIGTSGDWKTEQINAIHDNETTRILRSITKNTLISGYKGAKDLAPELKDKLLLIPEGAQILTINKDDKNAVFAQLRDLYDGYAGADKGSGTRAKYKDLNVSMIAGCTPFIDGQQLIHQQLGTRELFYRTSKGDIISDEELMDKVEENADYEIEMRHELRMVTCAFINTHEYDNIKPGAETKKKIRNLVNYVRLMRASAEIDFGTGELRAEVFPEKPTRIYKQFLLLFSALKSLTPGYSDDKVLLLLEHISKSCASQNRVKTLNHLIKMKVPQTTNNIHTRLKLGYKTIYTELNILWNMGIINRNECDADTGYGVKPVREWEIIRSNQLIKAMLNKENLLFQK